MQNKWSNHKIILITPTASQPRYHKRVTQFAAGCNVIVFAFSRGYYDENIFPAKIPFVSLGKIKDGKYFRRLFRVIAAVFMIRTHLRDRENCFYYAMSFDCMIIARLCGLKHGFYEIGDLRQAEGFGKLFAFLEKMLVKRASGLVLTSRYFYHDFYRKKGILPRQRIYIIDNKINQLLANKRPYEKNISRGRIVIGVVGLLRYRRPIELLLGFVKKRPESYIIECFGDGIFRGLVESYVCENIRYHGSFKNPEELPDIYARLDLNYVVYDNSSKNVRLAIPNKIFESAYFGVPIVCCEGTSVGKMAMEWQIGKTVQIDSKDNFEDDLGTIDKSWLNKCSENCFKIPSSELIDNGEQIIQKMLVDAGEYMPDSAKMVRKG